MEKKQLRSADASSAEMQTNPCEVTEAKWVDSIFNVPEGVGGGLLNRFQRALASKEGQCMSPEMAIRFELLQRVLSTLDKPTEKRDSGDGSKGGLGGGLGGSGDGTGCVPNTRHFFVVVVAGFFRLRSDRFVSSNTRALVPRAETHTHTRTRTLSQIRKSTATDSLDAHNMQTHVDNDIDTAACHRFTVATRYGSGDTQSVWDREEWVKNQERHAQSEVAMLKCIGQLLSLFSKSNWSDPSTPAGQLSAAPVPAETAATIVEVLATSPLCDRLLQLVSTDSMVDLAEHRPMYDAAIKVTCPLLLYSRCSCIRE